MAVNGDAFAQKRKEKRWLVFQKAYVTYNGAIYEAGGSNALRMMVKAAEGTPGQTGYEPEVNVAITGDPWILVDEIGSFELAKKKVIELAQELGLAKVKLSRCVDLYTVLYPIS